MRSGLGANYMAAAAANYSGARLPGDEFSAAFHHPVRPAHAAPAAPTIPVVPVVPATDAGGQIDLEVHVSGEEDRFVRRFDWFGNGVGGMSTKLMSCVLAVASGILAFVPFGSTACGLWVSVSLFVTVFAAGMLFAFVGLLLAALIDYRVAKNKNEVHTVDEDVTRTEDRRFTIFYAFLGTFVYGLILFVNLVWVLQNWDVDTKTELLAETGHFVSEPLAATAALSSGMAAFVAGSFVIMLYTNVIARYNRDRFNILFSDRAE